MKNDLADDLPSIEKVLRGPAASLWLRNALRAALVRDPVDAANDAEVLARLLDRRCRSILSQFDEDKRPS
jgi:hypothetical protein